MDEFGTFDRQADQTTLRFERRYPSPIQTVWAALTTPERLADWLGAGVVEPHAGGRFELFVDRTNADARMTGRVLQWQPPTLLEFTWKVGPEPESIARWELSEDGPNATRLVLTHGKMEYKWVGLVLPGWHSLLERLTKTLETGEATVDSPERWRELQAVYVDHYKLASVMLDPPPGHCG
jgi:uncharacterized protein YndB with AHSA1/START domain